MPPRVAILPPVPVPYREPLFRALAERGNVIPHVVYLAARQPGWDQPESWFSDAEGYGSEVLALVAAVAPRAHSDHGSARHRERRSHGLGRTAW